MSLAIVDVREWQNVLDLRTGKKVSADTPAVRMVRSVLEKHPYPGDIELSSNQWVTDTALDLIEKYDPGFVFLSYAQQYFSLRFTPLAEAERGKMIDAVFTEIERFTRESGFFTIVVGTGDMTPITGIVDLSRLDGLAVSSNWATRYAGLYGLSHNDLDYLRNKPEIERLVSKEELISAFHGTPEDAGRLPDYFAVSREGICFKSPYLRQPVMIPGDNRFIPVLATLGDVQSITDISGFIQDYLRNNKVALIMVEGVGERDFRFAGKPCSNGPGWYFYEPGEAQYLALSTGEHQFFKYNPGYRYYLDEDESQKYPFSGYFNEIPENTIGRKFAGRSIAVGNRSMFMHTVTGTDIAIECFARNLYNQGCLAVIHRQDK